MAGPRQGTATRERGQNQVRRILAEAQRLLIAEGYAGLTNRKVAKNLGISLGNLTYYFPTKDKLLEALISNMLDGHNRAFEVERLHFPDEPFARFEAYLDHLISDCRESNTRATFFQIWGLATHHEAVRNLREFIYAHFRDQLDELLRPLRPELSDKDLSYRVAATVAMIEGLHVIFDLQPKTLGTTSDFDSKIREEILTIATRN